MSFINVPMILIAGGFMFVNTMLIFVGVKYDGIHMLASMFCVWYLVYAAMVNHLAEKNEKVIQNKYENLVNCYDDIVVGASKVSKENETLRSVIKENMEDFRSIVKEHIV